MKTIKITLLAVALGLTPCVIPAQNTEPAALSIGQSADRNSHKGPHLLPPGAEIKLNLTDEQKAKIAALEAEVKTKMAAILSPEQLAQLAQMHPPRGGHGALNGQSHNEAPDMPPGLPPQE